MIEFCQICHHGVQKSELEGLYVVDITYIIRPSSNTATGSRVKVIG